MNRNVPPSYKDALALGFREDCTTTEKEEICDGDALYREGNLELVHPTGQRVVVSYSARFELGRPRQL